MIATTQYNDAMRKIGETYGFTAYELELVSYHVYEGMCDPFKSAFAFLVGMYDHEETDADTLELNTHLVEIAQKIDQKGAVLFDAAVRQALVLDYTANGTRYSVQTPDGFVFDLCEDGSVTDGDMTFDSIAALVAEFGDDELHTFQRDLV